MDNAQKAIMIGVGLFITIIVIAAVMLITGMGQDLLNSGTQEISGISESLKQQITDQYDNKIMTKTQVRTATIDLLNKDTSGITVVFYDEDYTGQAAIESFKTAFNATGTNSNQKYRGSVTYDSTTGLTTVTFTEGIT